jgi:hypothetical protein
MVWNPTVRKRTLVFSDKKVSSWKPRNPLIMSFRFAGLAGKYHPELSAQRAADRGAEQ